MFTNPFHEHQFIFQFFWEALKNAGSYRIAPDRAGLCRSTKKKSNIFPKKLFQKFFWAKHTKGLKPFRANLGYDYFKKLFSERKNRKKSTSAVLSGLPRRVDYT